LWSRPYLRLAFRSPVGPEAGAGIHPGEGTRLPAGTCRLAEEAAHRASVAVDTATARRDLRAGLAQAKAAMPAELIAVAAVLTRAAEVTSDADMRDAGMVVDTWVRGITDGVTAATMAAALRLA
jgi:hypothetical protein